MERNVFTEPPWHIITKIEMQHGIERPVTLVRCQVGLNRFEPDGFDHTVAVCYGPDHLANAQLFAAAPDLLAALQNFENDDGSVPKAIWDLRAEAIAKAIKQGAAS